MWWQWHQLDHMQITCTIAVFFLQTACSSWRPTNSVNALKAYTVKYIQGIYCVYYIYIYTYIYTALKMATFLCFELECGPMPNVMAALPTTGGALCWTPQFGWRALLVCHAVTLPRCETCCYLQECPKLANRSQPLVGRSSPYYEYMCRRYRCLTSFFPIVDTCLSCEDTARQICAMVPKWRFFASCICSEQRAAHFRPAF